MYFRIIVTRSIIENNFVFQTTVLEFGPTWFETNFPHTLDFMKLEQPRHPIIKICFRHVKYSVGINEKYYYKRGCRI